MKKKALSLLLSTAMVASLAACGNETTPATTDTQTADNTTATEAPATEAPATTDAETPAAAEDYTLETLNIVVDGTLTATVENGQDAFKSQWEAAVSEKLGHPVTLNINQLDHSDYSGTVSRLLTTGQPGDPDPHRGRVRLRRGEQTGEEKEGRCQSCCRQVIRPGISYRKNRTRRDGGAFIPQKR